MQKYSKSKSGPNQAGPGYRTPDHFRAAQAGKGGVFSGQSSKFSSNVQQKGAVPQAKFNPAQFKTQHKG